MRSLRQLWKINSSRRKIISVPLCLFGLYFMILWTWSSNSASLVAFLCLVTTDIITLLGDLLNQSFHQGESSSCVKSVHSFNFEFARIEVLIHFLISCLGIILYIFAFFLSLLLLKSGSLQNISINHFIPNVIVGSCIHFFLSFNNNPLLKVYKVSGTRTECQSCFQSIFLKLKLFRTLTNHLSQSPIATLGFLSISTLVFLSFALTSGLWLLDFFGAILIILGIHDAVYPLFIYTGQVLLQRVPSNILNQIEKAMREALTIDGVLEFRNEFFWILSYGQMAGVLHVRVRRDANEQAVIKKIQDKLHPLVPNLTVQIIKDDFVRHVTTLQPLPNLNNLHYSPHASLSHFPTELSPIARNHSQHVIYSTTGTSPQSTTYRDETALNISHLSSVSSVFDTPSIVIGSNGYSSKNSSLSRAPMSYPYLEQSSSRKEGMRSNELLHPTYNNGNSNQNTLLSSATFY